MSDLHRRIASLSPEKRALLESRLRRETVAAPAEPIPRRPSAGPAPLSFAQRRLWFLDQYDPGQAHSTLPVSLRLTGEIDVPALTRSLDAIVARHEALRTTFAARDGEPVQVIGPARRLAVERHDVSTRPEGRDAALRKLFLEALGRPFDLTAGPLVRALLVREDDRTHVVILLMHHIASDGWSVGVLLGELTALYAGERSGMGARLPELPIQYADYAAWQREHLQGEVLASSLSYWKERLAGDRPALALPSDLPRPLRRTLAGTQEVRRYSSDLVKRLEALSREEGVSLFMVLLAAFQILLARLSGQEEVLVGTPIAGRNRTETEGLIGCFVNTLVLRGDVSGNPTFREFLGRVRETALGAYAHQELPFETLVEELRPERQDAVSPLFQVMFSFENEPTVRPQIEGLEVEELELGTLTSAFDLSVDVTEEWGGGLQVSAEYAKELFEGETVKRWLEGFEVLLEGVVGDPGGRIWELPVMTEKEKRQLGEWSGEGGRETGRCVHELFEERAREKPEATAAEYEGEQRTYGELEERANRLGQYLKGKGVGPGVRVGVCVERSLELPVALLGVLKAGGAYVPLDPGYPAERLRYFLEDSGVKVVVTESRPAGVLGEGPWETVRVDAEKEEIGKASGERPQSAVKGSDLAYVLYTSGTTGRPKGVMVEHRSLTQHALGIVERYELTGKDRVLQFASLSFDVAGEEMYPTWAAGGAVVYRRGEAVSIGEFEKQVETWKPTVMNLPAGFWHEWVVEMGKRGGKAPEGLRLLVTGSDRVLPERVKWWREHTGVRILNGYGPTEATITATVYEPGKREPRTACVPIGRPLPGVRVRVVDGHGGLCPIGVAGELWIGGVGVARGYWGLGEQTAEKFVVDGETGDRMYRTGDRVRYLGDGNLEFLGRQDGQVKVRGYRIEPGEIEAALERDEGVKEAAVVAREEGGETRLVAYVVLEEGRAVGGVKEQLRERVPGYMVPAQWVEMGVLPRTESGKVDRRRLPEPGQTGGGQEEGYVAPQTPLEEAVAKIWGELLHREKVGAKDNFFDLGGHSLLATQVVSRLREAFGVELPLKRLFESPTVEQLAVAIAEGQAQQAEPEELQRLLEEIERESPRV